MSSEQQRHDIKEWSLRATQKCNRETVNKPTTGNATRRTGVAIAELSRVARDGRHFPPLDSVPGLPDPVTREAYSHEVSSAGFWPGSDAYPQAAFYSYAYPAPPGFSRASIQPAGAVWVADLGEWLLPYAAVQAAPDPDAVLLRFLETTYRAAADLGGGDRSLDCAIGVPGRPRALQASNPEGAPASGD